MNNTKHTPGPWEVEKARNGLPYRIIAPSGDNQKAGTVGTRITRWGAITLPSSQEGNANARLIAAAPELLEALQGVMTDPNFDWDIARTAIAKATGERP